MKESSKKPLYLPISFIAAAVIIVLIINLFIMTKVNGSRTEELGRMRIELIAADLRKRLDACTDSLNKIGNRLSDLMETDYTDEDLRRFLSEEKKKEIASTGRTCLNIFCVTPDGRVLISELKNIPVIFLTADDDQNTETEGFKAGAMNFIRKPFIPDIMLRRVGRMLELHRLQTYLAKEVKRQTKYAQERQERMERLSRETVLSLAKAVEAKDKYTNGHSERVARYARLIAERAGMNETDCNDIYFVGLLHDIGKIGIPDTVINKTSRLTDEEFAMIKEHPIIWAKILKDITEMPGIEKGARWHHERYDGKGYPDGIKGEEIPEFSRIICVADAYDAMTSTRSYRDILPQEKVRAEIVKGRGTQFDPKFADIMIGIIDEDKDYKMRG